MSDNVLQTLQQLIQDVIAPDVRELKVRMTALEKQFDGFEKHTEAQFDRLDKRMDGFEKHTETQFDRLDKQIEAKYSALEKQSESKFSAMRDQQDANFKAIMAAIGESKAKGELETYKMITALSERVAALEAAAH